MDDSRTIFLENFCVKKKVTNFFIIIFYISCENCIKLFFKQSIRKLKKKKKEKRRRVY